MGVNALETYRPKTTYVELRRASLEFLQLSIEQCQETANDLRKRLRALRETKLDLTSTELGSESPQVLQRRLQAVLQEIRVSQANMSALRTDDDYRREYDTIRNLFGVQQIAVENSVVRITLYARIEHAGKFYDNGDWMLTIDVETGSLVTCRTREIVPKKVAGEEIPGVPYIISSDQFCFGNNLPTVERLIRSGDYKAGLSFAIACMQSVNKEHEPYVPKIFHERK